MKLKAIAVCTFLSHLKVCAIWLKGFFFSLLVFFLHVRTSIWPVALLLKHTVHLEAIISISHLCLVHSCIYIHFYIMVLNSELGHTLPSCISKKMENQPNIFCGIFKWKRKQGMKRKEVKYHITHWTMCIHIVASSSSSYTLHRYFNNVTAHCCYRCSYRWQLTKCDTSGWWM